MPGHLCHHHLPRPPLEQENPNHQNQWAPQAGRGEANEVRWCVLTSFFWGPKPGLCCITNVRTLGQLYLEKRCCVVREGREGDGTGVGATGLKSAARDQLLQRRGQAWRTGVRLLQEGKKGLGLSLFRTWGQAMA